MKTFQRPCASLKVLETETVAFKMEFIYIWSFKKTLMNGEQVLKWQEIYGFANHVEFPRLDG